MLFLNDMKEAWVDRTSGNNLEDGTTCSGQWAFLKHRGKHHVDWNWELIYAAWQIANNLP